VISRRVKVGDRINGRCCRATPNPGGLYADRYPAAGRLIDIAIINWNTAQAAADAAEAFAASKGVDTNVTVVDNRSADEQRQLLGARSQATRFEVLFSERNLGFGTAANLALGRGSAPLVCISNSDVVPLPTALAEMAAVAFDNLDAGMVGPAFTGGTQHYHCSLPGRTALLARAFVGAAGARALPSPAPGEVEEVGQVSGACFVMRRDVWEEVGGFDEGYFLWYEDVDLAKRLHDSGRRNLVVGSALVSHAGAASFTQIDSRTAQAIRLASLRLYIERHHSKLMPIARPFLATARALRARGASGNP
jgi:N-acetylglucosaminyl-diphospho-decaprenol L-rhamnosyltransferase